MLERMSNENAELMARQRSERQQLVISEGQPPCTPETHDRVEVRL